MDKNKLNKKTPHEKHLPLRLLIIVGSLLVTLVPMIAVSIVSFYSSRDLLLEAAYERRAQDVTLQAAEIESKFQFFSNNVTLLSKTPPIQGIYRALQNDGVDPVDGSSLQLWKDRLATIFSVQAETDQSYHQIQYLDAAGNELVRVNSRQGRIERVPESDLQYKHDRYYFTAVTSLGRDEIFVSDLDLNREGIAAEIEMPLQLVIRYGAPVFSETSGELIGAVVIAVRADTLFDELYRDDQLSRHEVDLEFVADQDGYYLFHDDRAKEWGSEADLGTGENVTNDFSPAVRQGLLSGERGVIEDTQLDELIVYEAIHFKPQDDSQFIVIAQLTNLDRALAPVAGVRVNIYLIALVSAVIALILAIIFSDLISRPVHELTRVARAFRAGNYLARSRAKSATEIGILSEAFNEMSDRVLDARAELEAKVEQRTTELAMSVEELEQQRKAVLNILEDIDVEKKKSEALAQDLLKFQMAVEDASDHIIITDPDGIILFANKSVERITGFSRQEVLGKKAGAKELWGGLMKPDFYKKMWQTIAVEKKSFAGEITNKKKSGVIYNAQASIAPVLDKKGRVQFFVGIERDITREKQIDKAKTEFVSLASHQLRTPLSTINWYTEMLLNGDAGEINKEQREFLNSVYTGSKRMVSLVNALLNVSRIELGTLSIEPEEVRVTELADGVVEEVAPIIKEKSLGIKKNYAHNLPKLMLDPNLMRIVFQNLITNAVKYTPEKGMIELTIALENDTVSVSVKDNGYGIPKDQQEHIFSKLFRADNVRQKDTEGTGLGLYVAKSVVETAGGKIWFESEENKGTTFTFTIPLRGMEKKEGTKGLIGLK